MSQPPQTNQRQAARQPAAAPPSHAQAIQHPVRQRQRLRAAWKPAFAASSFSRSVFNRTSGGTVLFGKIGPFKHGNALPSDSPGLPQGSLRIVRLVEHAAHEDQVKGGGWKWQDLRLGKAKRRKLAHSRGPGPACSGLPSTPATRSPLAAKASTKTAVPVPTSSIALAVIPLQREVHHPAHFKTRQLSGERRSAAEPRPAMRFRHAILLSAGQPFSRDVLVRA